MFSWPRPSSLVSACGLTFALILVDVEASFLAALAVKQKQTGQEGQHNESARVVTRVRHHRADISFNQSSHAKLNNSDHDDEFFLQFCRHQPAQGVAVTGSVIWLDSWAAEPGWFNEWFGEEIQRLVSSAPSIRVIEAVGRQYHHADGPYRGWYSYEDWHNEIPNEDDLTLGVSYVHQLIQQEFAIVGDYRKIALAGYSQGANIALEAAFRFPAPLGLVLSQRGVVLQSRLNDFKSSSASPFVFTAGLDDTTYSVEHIKYGCRAVRTADLVGFFKSYGNLDHFRCSERENALAIDSFLAVVKELPPQSVVQLGHLTSWSDC